MREGSTHRGRKAPANCYWRDGVLWGRIQVRGQILRWSLRTSDGRIALRRIEERRQREIAASHFGEIRHSYDDVFAAWSAWVVNQVGPETAKRYAVSLNQLAPWLRPLFVDEINGARIGEIVKARQAKASNATVRRDLTALSSLLGYAELEEWRDDNPALSWLRRLRERRDPIVLPDPRDVAAVLAIAPGMLPQLLTAYRLTGCRLSELVHARRANFDRARRQLTIIGKGNKLRVIDLDAFGAFDLIEALPAFLGSPWLFWHGAGEPYRNLSSRVSALVNRAAAHALKPPAAPGGHHFRKFRLHDLRHLHAVEWLKAGRSIYDLQRRLGHASVKTTEIYLAHLTPEEARAVMYGPPQKPSQEASA